MMVRMRPASLLLFSLLASAVIVTPAEPQATSSKRRAVRSAPPSAPQQQTVILTPSKDATLYELSNGSLANGAGIHLFAGSTASSQRRRALVAFDVASQIPPGSVITSAVLTLQVSLTVAATQPTRLHPVTSDWSEGASNAGDSRDGGGTSSLAGDATWLHTAFPDRFWRTPGGDFSSTPDATASVGSFGPFSWGSSAALVARVQSWVDQPATNFGWIVIGNEATSRTTKRLDSREGAANARPTLTVEFLR